MPSLFLDPFFDDSSANGNRYEGFWQDSLKHGDGKFFYLDKVAFLKICNASLISCFRDSAMSGRG
jgi:hypothetical protein